MTSDELGINEAMKDISEDGKGINVTAKYHLLFQKDRVKLYRAL